MVTYRGLTWDHPRGRCALEEAAHRLGANGGEIVIHWDTHPLEGFESTPISQLAEHYDVIVLDHPHLGEAVNRGCLRPLDDIFEAAEIERWATDTVGPSFHSYKHDGHLWALPLDAATQVAVFQPGIDDHAPKTWDEVATFADEHSVVLSLSGPHAFLTFASLCVALGEEPARGHEDLPLVSRNVGLEVFGRLTRLAAGCPSGSAEMSPIELLSRMAKGAFAAYCPLVFGYVNYALASRARPLQFVDAPSINIGGRHGSTVGGTGLALTRRSEPSAELIDHFRWLLAPDTQREYIPAFAGQPSARAAWNDDEINRSSGNFYRGTILTMETSWVRPRYDGYIAFQAAASEVIRSVLRGGDTPSDGLNQLDRLYKASRNNRLERRSA